MKEHNTVRLKNTKYASKYFWAQKLLLTCDIYDVTRLMKT